VPRCSSRRFSGRSPSGRDTGGALHGDSGARLALRAQHGAREVPTGRRRLPERSPAGTAPTRISGAAPPQAAAPDRQASALRQLPLTRSPKAPKALAPLDGARSGGNSSGLMHPVAPRSTSGSPLPHGTRAPLGRTRSQVASQWEPTSIPVAIEPGTDVTRSVRPPALLPRVASRRRGPRRPGGPAAPPRSRAGAPTGRRRAPDPPREARRTAARAGPSRSSVSSARRAREINGMRIRLVRGYPSAFAR
jgi:hypothetical protein